MSTGGWRAIVALAATLVAAPPALADPPAGAQAAEVKADRARREDQLRTLEQRASASTDQRRRLEQEIAGLRADRTRLAAALVTAGERAKAAEERVRAVEARLDALLLRESDLRRSLEGRRAVIAEILAALQRMGRRPPPALLVEADDILSAIRAAMALGSTLPGLRDEARRLSADLTELTALKSAIAADRGALDAEFAALAAERDRLAALVGLRQQRLAAAELDVGRERNEAERLGREARTLRELIDRAEREPAPAAMPAVPPPPVAALPPAAAAPPDTAPADDAEARRIREQLASAALQDPVRLAPRRPFVEVRGALVRPVAGRTLRAFGAPDGSGGTLRGMAFGARPRAVVTSSADGWVVFAGPFRSYGRLLIINAGGGYYLMLAGMERLDVEVGQFVLAGEPVGQMGEVAAPSAALSVVEADGPVLYVELRKDGGPIDPGPWWAKSQGERARG